MKQFVAEFTRKFSSLAQIAVFGWIYHYTDYQIYSYLVLLLALLIHLFVPKTMILEGTAYYSKILLLDIMGFAFRASMIIFFFSMTTASHTSLGGVVLLLMLFSIYLLYLWQSAKFSGRRYFFNDVMFPGGQM